jgi:excinuclease UvrABC ATPase subunit
MLVLCQHQEQHLPGRLFSGKSSLAFGTLYAEAQRRYLESVSPYARRLFNQMAVPEVQSIDGLPPAVAKKRPWCPKATRGARVLQLNRLNLGHEPAGVAG